jgi:hypothetical protein
MRTTRFSDLLLPILLLVATVATAQPTYDLKLGRMLKAFDRYLLKATYDAETTTKLFIADIQRGDEQRKISLRLNAQCSVAAVTVDGQEKEKHLIIRDFRRMTTMDTVDLLPTGTKVRCWFSDSGSVFTINDRPAPDSITTLLGFVVKGEGGALNGKLLNAKKPVPVGATWKLNIPAFRSVLGSEVSSYIKKVDGTVTFVGIDSSATLAVARVEATASAPKFTMKVGDTPATSSLTATFRLEVPVDTRYPPEAIETTTVQTIVSRQGNVRMEMNVRTGRSARFIR